MPRTEDNEELARNQEGVHKQLEVAEIDMQSDLAALIKGLTQYLELENADITAYRVSMTVERAAFTKELSMQILEEETYMLHKYVDAEPMPLRLPVRYCCCCFVCELMTWLGNHQRGREPSSVGKESPNTANFTSGNCGRAHCHGLQEISGLFCVFLFFVLLF